ncbi:hypothetical protein [Microbulbifer variabilis]|uniref:Uncharacterized protein n=1 Tax=Microbulbifer variabilis TaxID=266805 RepID=A0ABY4V6L4_9GAMM|nr:hypothetical protein [Microbulbifer variabilis]USD19915.1 hypothetical protein MJO52_12590 [Microbulbifer variabilis]
MSMDKENISDFSGKCISMRLTDLECSHDLHNPRFEYQGGKLFIVGEISVGCSESGWNAGHIGAAEWAQVRSYMLFDGFKAYTKAIKVSESYYENSEEKNS